MSNASDALEKRRYQARKGTAHGRLRLGHHCRRRRHRPAITHMHTFSSRDDCVSQYFLSANPSGLNAQRAARDSAHHSVLENGRPFLVPCSGHRRSPVGRTQAPSRSASPPATMVRVRPCCSLPRNTGRMPCHQHNESASQREFPAAFNPTYPPPPPFPPRVHSGCAPGAASTLTLEDSGVGMTRTELVENLGTIARSGTRVRPLSLLGGVKIGDRARVRLTGLFL